MDVTVGDVLVTTAGGIGLLGGGLWYASVWPTSQIFGETLIAGHDPREIALTFDDGPNSAATLELLDVLARHNVRATFFAMGDFAKKQPGLVRQAAMEGHLIGNHTMSHPTMSIQPEARIREEIAGCNAVLEDITGKPVRYFRPPFGARRPAVLRVARELGLVPVTWNVTAYDWDPIGPARVLANIEAGIKRNRSAGRGSNVLLHDGGHRAMGTKRMDTVIAVDQLIGRQASAANFVTVDAWKAMGGVVG
jgi:peptidoglycan/xylan/chitin deacetylase (PgdA/CDA1 family)